MLALVRYDSAPPVHRGSDTATFTVTKPVVIANIAYTQADVDADTNQGMIEVVDDFDTYLGPIGDSLEKQGVQLESANVRVIRVHVDTAWYTYSFVTEDGRVGYVLAAPGHVPQLLSGVRTDFDLPGDVREYLTTGKAEQAETQAADTQRASHDAAGPVHFGVVYDVRDSSADGIFGFYQNGRFVADTMWPQLPLRQVLHGVSMNGRVEQVVIDSTNRPEDAGPGWTPYRARLTPPLHDSTASVLFWDGDLRAHPVAATPGTVSPGLAAILQARGRELFRLALGEADSDMVAKHDHIVFSDPLMLRIDSLGLDALDYRVTLMNGTAIADERASVFFLYSERDRQVRFATFGHPEWGTDAEHVFAVFPRAFFRIDGDSRIYMLAVSFGAWEANGVWIIIDAATGEIVNLPLKPLGK